MAKNTFIKTAKLSAALLWLAHLASTSALALNKKMHELVEYECNANAACTSKNAATSEEAVAKYLEIPTRLLTFDRAERLPEEIYKALFFEKNGENYFHWIIHPTDQHYFRKVQSYLRDQNISAEPKMDRTKLLEFRTASRSLIIESPETGAQFGYKTSTSHAGGKWPDKPQEIPDSRDIRLIADYLHQLQIEKPFKNIVIQDEPLTVAIPEINQAVAIRNYGYLTHEENRKGAIPLFSALHEKVGAEIAAKFIESKKSLTVTEFWTPYVSEKLGEALGEFAGRTGLTIDSPHAQNFLLELGPNNLPTGRVILRDIGDVHLHVELLEKLGASKLVTQFSDPKNIRERQMAVAIGYFIGSHKPDWHTAASTYQWAQGFFRGFEKAFQENYGEKFRTTNFDMSGDWSGYIRKNYPIHEYAWEPEPNPYGILTKPICKIQTVLKKLF